MTNMGSPLNRFRSVLFPHRTLCRTNLERMGVLAVALALNACAGGDTGTLSPQVASGETPTQPAPDNSNPLADSNPAPTSDQTAPLGAVTSPKSGASVSGLVTLTASASDPTLSGQTTSGLASVQFLVGGANFGPTLTTAPFTVQWDTRLAANGKQDVAVRVRDMIARCISSIAARKGYMVTRTSERLPTTSLTTSLI